MNGLSPRLIALDWGTSSLRAFLLTDAGAVLETETRPWGIMHLPTGGFAAALRETVGRWRAAWPAIPLIAAGMVGSRQGWKEAEYCPCPAGAAELAGALCAVSEGVGGVMRIVPGVRQEGTAPNVMRGEETQIVGAMEQVSRPGSRALLVLPGTHSKWVTVEGGKIARFETYMTGELFAVLRDHSILGRPARDAAPPPEPAWDAFDRGVATARAAGARGLAPNLFLTRSLMLQGTLTATESLDFLSGLLIGDELRAALGEAGQVPLALLGGAALCSRYTRALAGFGVSGVACLDNTSASGMWRIAALAGLISTSSGLDFSEARS